MIKQKVLARLLTKKHNENSFLKNKNQLIIPKKLPLNYYYGVKLELILTLHLKLI